MWLDVFQFGGQFVVGIFEFVVFLQVYLVLGICIKVCGQMQGGVSGDVVLFVSDFVYVGGGDVNGGCQCIG